MKNHLLVTALALVISFSAQAQDPKKTMKETKHITQTDTTTGFGIPASLKAEHEELHKTLEKFTKLPGKTGAAAKNVAKMLHPHFVKEEQYALPQLGLLPALAKGQKPTQTKEVIAMSEKLKQDFQHMLTEHQQIVATLDELNKAAQAENHPEVIRFTEALKLHAQNEEQVLYPTAILIGEYLKLQK